MVKWYYKKKTQIGVPHMLAPRRGSLDYSIVYCDVRKRWFLAWNQNRYITYYIFHIQYTNSEISIGLLYILPHFAWSNWLNHCVALVRNLPTSILVRASVSLLTFHTHTSIILVLLWFANFESCRLDSRTFPFLRCPVLLTRLACHGRSCRTTSKVLSSSLKKKDICKY